VGTVPRNSWRAADSPAAHGGVLGSRTRAHTRRHVYCLRQGFLAAAQRATRCAREDGGAPRRRRDASTGLAAQRQLDLCRDHGVNLIDTADVHFDGRSEEIVGEAVEGRRDDWLIATKVRFPMGPGPNDAGLTRHHILSAAEASLRRAADRLHRPLPVPRVGRSDAARGVPRCPGPDRPAGKGPLRRRQQLRRLAAARGAGSRRAETPAPVGLPADLLLATGP
jgi:hypothetical protein